MSENMPHPPLNQARPFLDSSLRMFVLASNSLTRHLDIVKLVSHPWHDLALDESDVRRVLGLRERYDPLCNT